MCRNDCDWGFSECLKTLTSKIKGYSSRQKYCLLFWMLKVEHKSVLLRFFGRKHKRHQETLQVQCDSSWEHRGVAPILRYLWPGFVESLRDRDNGDMARRC